MSYVFRWLGWLNAASVIAVVLMCTIFLITKGRAPGVITYTTAPNTFLTTFKAITGIVFVYAAQYIYLEIIAEMVNPAHFIKSLTAAGPYQVGMYVYTASVCYYMLGAGVPSFLTRVISFGPEFRVVSFLLFFHVVVTYLIKGLVLTRALHVAIWPKTVNDKSWRGYGHWFILTVVTLSGSWLVGNAIPFFDDLSGLIGAMVSCPAVFTLPIIFYWRQAQINKINVPVWERVFLILLFLFSILIVVVGVYTNIISIIANSKAYGLPFSCHCTSLWNTCKCSSSQMPPGTCSSSSNHTTGH